MEGLITLWWAIVQGFFLAAPVGPIALLCMQTTLASGFWAGITAGIGVACADATYAAIAAFGLGVITTFLTQSQAWISFFGGIFLVYLGWKIAAQQSRLEPREQTAVMPRYFRIFSSTMLLTFINPLTILLFVSLFSGWGYTPTGQIGALLTAGVFIGSFAWWLVLVTLVFLLRKVMSFWFLKAINVFSGLILLEFGLYMLWTALGL